MFVLELLLQYLILILHRPPQFNICMIQASIQHVLYIKKGTFDFFHSVRSSFVNEPFSSFLFNRSEKFISFVLKVIVHFSSVSFRKVICLVKSFVKENNKKETYGKISLFSKKYRSNYFKSFFSREILLVLKKYSHL